MQRPLAVAFVLAALVSGCVVEEDGDESGDGGSQGASGSRTSSASPPGGGQGFAPQQGTATGSRDGIHVDVTWRACEAGFCANATATNRGTATVRVSSICESPWTDRMAREGEPVQHREGMATCLAYGRADFAPGDKAYANFTWDQRVHEDEASHPAPQGAYTWSIAFWWEPQDGELRREAAADIQLVVGET